MKTIIISNIAESVIEKEHITFIAESNSWQRMQYETSETVGELLLAGELSSPRPVTICTGNSGWYKIFVGMINLRQTNYIYLKLSDDDGFSGIRTAGSENPCAWAPEEYAEEVFWKCADLTNQNFILAKPDFFKPNVCALAWIKLVPMTDDEIAAELLRLNNIETRCVQYHFDEDLNAEDSLDCREALLVKEEGTVNTDVELVSMEISFDYDLPENKDYIPIRASDKRWSDKDYNFVSQSENAYKLRIEKLHEKGIKVYAANRMSAASFQTPYSLLSWRKRFVDEHPEYYCETRGGKTVKVCSYAYSEVQDYVIENLCRYVQLGFDGVTLLFIRGLHVGFEKPVRRLFYQKHSIIDIRQIPSSDERLNGIWCGIMTGFMKRLREKLDKTAGKHVPINVITDYAPESFKNYGMDISDWAQNGLIDTVTQGHMEIYEDIADCVDSHGLIDLKLYNEKNRTQPVVKRCFTTVYDKMLAGAEKFKKITDRYDIDFYAALPWNRTASPKEFISYSEKLREIGVNKFFMWNANQMWNLPEHNTVSMLGQKRIPAERYEVKYYRVLSLDNSDISEFNPNWRG